MKEALSLGEGIAFRIPRGSNNAISPAPELSYRTRRTDLNPQTTPAIVIFPSLCRREFQRGSVRRVHHAPANSGRDDVYSDTRVAEIRRKKRYHAPRHEKVCRTLIGGF